MHTQVLDIKTTKILFLYVIFICFAIGPVTFKIP
jgi:hypothetical protein